MPANQTLGKFLRANALSEFAGTAYSRPLSEIKKTE